MILRDDGEGVCNAQMLRHRGDADAVSQVVPR